MEVSKEEFKAVAATNDLAWYYVDDFEPITWDIEYEDMVLEMNLDGPYKEMDGCFSLGVYKPPKSFRTKFLERSFVHPLYPTEMECELFEIEHGFKYPLKPSIKP